MLADMMASTADNFDVADRSDGIPLKRTDSVSSFVHEILDSRFRKRKHLYPIALAILLCLLLGFEIFNTFQFSKRPIEKHPVKEQDENVSLILRDYIQARDESNAQESSRREYKPCPRPSIKLMVQNSTDNFILYYENYVVFDKESKTLTVHSYQSNTQADLTFNSSAINQFHKFFDKCFGKSDKCALPSKLDYESRPGNSIFCSNHVKVAYILTVCYDFHGKLSGAFSGNRILYPDFLRDMFLLIESIE